MIVTVAMKVPVLRSYLPPRLIVHAASDSGQGSTTTQLEGLVSLMRSETADDHLGGRALLNALSTAMFALVLRLASEAHDAPRGLLAVAGHPRLAPAMVALFQNPSRAWSLPELAPVQHVASDVCPSVSGQAWTLGRRSHDGHPHDTGRKQTADVRSFNR